MKSLKFLMKFRRVCGMLAAVGLPLNLVAQATITLYPQDADGWSIVAPLADSRVIHVSSSVGNDAADGLSPATPVRTLARGFSLLRNNSADQMLLRRGDIWVGETFAALRNKNGHSAMQRLLIGAYGEGSERPIVDTGVQGVINTDGSPSSNIAVIGIDFYASGRDPASPTYAGHDAVGFAAGFRFVGLGDNILFEDNRIRYYGTALEFDGLGGRFSNVVIRRNIFYHSWRPNSYIIHVYESRSQGLYASAVDGSLMEENLFHHNGWNQVVPFAGANMYNHNVYLQYSNTDTVFRGNMVSMASAHGAQLRSGGYADDNFFSRNAIAMNLGGHGAPTRETNPWGLARNNVIIEGRLMDPNSTFGLRTSAVWALSSDYFPSTAIRNLIANRIHSGSNRAFNLGNTGGSWTLEENTVFQWESTYNQTNPGWRAPDRNVESYAAANGFGSAYADFWAIAADRPAGVWDYSLSAYALNEYLWEGFTVPVPLTCAAAIPASGSRQQPPKGVCVFTIPRQPPSTICLLGSPLNG
jgi:hypothetical protein